MQSGNSAATSSGPSGAASAVAPRKNMKGCWRKGVRSRIEVRCLLEQKPQK